MKIENRKGVVVVVTQIHARLSGCDPNNWQKLLAMEIKGKQKQKKIHGKSFVC